MAPADIAAVQQLPNENLAPMRSAYRRFSGLCLLLYAFVGVGLPLADGLLAAAGGPMAAHVEDATNRHDTGHDHVTCQVCRALDRNTAIGHGVAAAAPEDATDGLAIVRDRLSAAASGSHRASEARAPPRA